MYSRTSLALRTLNVTYLLYNKETGEFGNPVTQTLNSTSLVKRSLNDMAARYARKNGIKWDMLIICSVYGKLVSQRVRMYYNTK